MTQPGQPDPEPPAYPIGSVDSALRLLILLAERRRIRIAEAAEELGVARSTAHRLMQMLQFHRLAARDAESRDYSAGPVLFNIGLQVVRSLDIRTHARPVLEALGAETAETVRLLVLQEQREVVCIEAIESDRWVRVSGRVGAALPAHSTAAGRAVLALMPGDELRRLYPQARLPKPAGIGRTRAGLEGELARTRERGYAVELGEIDPEVSAVAAPIKDPDGRATFVIVVAVPSARMDDHAVRRLGKAVVAAADRVAQALPW